MGNYLFISDAAKEVKVESHVLRYWEEELHLPIKRNELGHRYYTEEDVERFKQIKGMKERGLQLKAIKMILKDGKLDMLVPKDGIAVNKEGIVDTDLKQLSGPESEQQKTEQEAKIRTERGAMQKAEGSTGKTAGSVSMPIDVVEVKETAVSADSKEEKSRRLQWLLQQLIRETLQENNSELCREIKESVVKELDYQFRMQEEREEARDKLLVERNEEHYRKMDELLRKKAKGKLRKEKADEKTRKEIEKNSLEDSEKNPPKGSAEKAEKKKRHFIF